MHGHTSRPQKYTVRKLKEPTKEHNGSESGFSPDEEHDHSFDGFGLYWEADAVARCLKEGRTECPQMTLAETLMTMQVGLPLSPAPLC